MSCLRLMQIYYLVRPLWKPCVSCQVIEFCFQNEHCENNRKRALSFHTTQTLRIGSDYQPNRRLVNTPTDSADTELFLMKRYSVADSISTSDRVKQQRVSPRHQGRAVEDSKSPRSAIKSESDETNATDQSSNLVENRLQPTTLSEAQEMMLDMKAVDSRASNLSLSQISLKQKESPRTKHKYNTDAVSHLQIEGQGVKLSPETAQQSPRFTGTAAAPREHRINSPKSSTRPVAHEAKSSGSLTSLLIRPVSLQPHHSGRTGATSVNQEQRGDRNSIEKDDTDDTGENKDTTAPGDSSSYANHVTADSEATAPSPEGSLTRPEEKDLPTESQNKGDATRDKREILTESEENSTSADCNEGTEDREVSPQKEDLQAAAGASALTKELTETSSSISQDLPVSHGDEMPKSPIVMVKTSPRPHSNRPSGPPYRPTSSSHKLRCA